MTVEMIFVGTELLLGNIVNTNAQFLSEQCAGLGLSVYYQTVVGDNETRLLDCLAQAEKRADILLIGGGLGPTEDDMTKETVAKRLGRPLVSDQKSRDQIAAYFQKKGSPVSENNWKQALVIEGSRVLYNANGTAPGMIVEGNGCTMILLPGPPNELIPMFHDQVKPYLQQITKETIVSAMIKICGIGESQAELMMRDVIDAQDNPTIATYAKTGEVHFRITAKAANKEQAQALLAPVIAEVQKRFGPHVYTLQEEETLEDVLVALLRRFGLTMTTAESCTGGLVGSRLVSVAGASEVYRMGFITYCDAAKQQLLHVKQETLAQYTAVSIQTAAEMAQGGAKEAGADVCVAITGYAGPGGGTEECPAGTVFISCSVSGVIQTERFCFSGSRNKVRELAAQHALDLARRCILKQYASGWIGQ